MNTLRAVFLPFALLVAAAARGQDGEVSPGPNLVTEGIPPIQTSLAANVGRYGEYRAASRQDWHPVRREMLISTPFGDTTQIHRLNVPGGARTQLTFFPDAVVRSSYPPDGKFFLFEKSSGGNEQFQHYRYDLDSSA